MKLFSIVSAVLSLIVVVGAQALAAYYAISLALLPLGYEVVDASVAVQVVGAVAAYGVSRLVASIVVSAHDSVA